MTYKTPIIIKLTAIIIFIIVFSAPSNAQFYNGHQMTFGKNRVQYGSFYWRYFRYDKFDSYFYGEGKDMSKRVAVIAEKKIEELENYFGHGLSKRVIFLCYNSMTDFRQSNIGYDPENEETSTGGVTRIAKNKVFIYYEGGEKKLEQQITKAIAEVIIKEILQSGSYRQKVVSSSLMNIPAWFIDGLTDYISQEWNPEIENKVKEGFQSGRYQKFNHLSPDDAIAAGHSLWYFTAETYGKDVIPNIVYLTRVNRSADNGFQYVVGSTVTDITPMWRAFYYEMFESSAQNGVALPKEDVVIKGRKRRIMQHAKTSPDGQYIAYVSNEKGKTKLWLYDTKTGKKKKIRRSGHKIVQITDYSYPVLGWHPTGQILSFIMEEEGEVLLYSYFLKTKELRSRTLLHFRKVLSFDYSPSGTMLAISGVKNNKTDIYVMNLTSGTSTRITDDLADDFNPVWAQGTDKILFSSNRISDSIYSAKRETPVQSTQDLFMYNYKTGSKLLERVTNTVNSDETSPITISDNEFMSLTDINGIRNRQIVKYDSTISHIDTAIHYRYFSTTKILTNYSQNIELYDFGKQQQMFYDVMRKDGRSYLYKNSFDPNVKLPGKSFRTPYMKRREALIKAEEQERLQELKDIKEEEARIDSLRKNPPKNMPHPDDILVDVNNYTFERDSENPYYKIYPISDSIPDIILKEEEAAIMQRNYLTHFYTDYVTQKLDLNYLGNSYQVYTGQAYSFTPGLNIVTKVGALDLFEDYKVSLGFSFVPLFDHTELVFIAENLKSRIDKQFIYYKQTQKQDYIDRYGFPFSGKMYSDEFLFIMKYPFSQVSSVRLTTSARYDRAVILSTDYNSLIADNGHQFFTGLKAEYIFDNSIAPSLNLHEGIRGKVFAEFYQEADQEYTNMFVTGLDFRFYKNIHRSLTFATRVGASSSFGKSKLIYYLGGVDGWYKFPGNRHLMFDESVAINDEVNYAYQAAATNMRGFISNSRNGTSFAVINSELRFPVVKYFVNRPVANDFINNFQVIGFVDTGSAWSGLTPYSDENAYNVQTITREPVSVIVNKNRPPVVFGYGMGIRSKLWGYFFRIDRARGVEYDVIHPRIWYFSLGHDF